MIWFLKQNNLLIKYFFTGGDKYADSVKCKEDILQPDGQMHVMDPLKHFTRAHLDGSRMDFNCKYGNMCKGTDILPYKRGKFGDYEFWIPNNSDPYLTKQRRGLDPVGR